MYRLIHDIKTSEPGVASRCPFCLAGSSPWPLVGTSLVFLNGISVGQLGEVVADKWGTCPADRFLVKMDCDNSGALQMVMPSEDLYLNVELLAVPPWMPPLSIEDNAALHNSLLYSVNKLAVPCDRPSVGDSLRWTIGTCWSDRLPLNGVDIWPSLAAHGVRDALKNDCIDYFDFGVNLLTSTNGRVAVKRRRMAPMSKARYLTSAQRKRYLKLFGHD